MGQSRTILNAVLDSIAVALNDQTIVYERYRQNPVEIESRNDIPRARISIYEQSEVVTTKVDAEYANLARTRYGIDISVLRAYNRDDASKGELPLADLKDSIVEWSKTFDASIATTAYIYTFGYEGSSSITRNPRYVTQTLNFSSVRDLFSNQTNPT